MQMRGRIEKECPWCAEMILAKAVVCKHCGRDVPGKFDQIEPSADPRDSAAPGLLRLGTVISEVGAATTRLRRVAVSLSVPNHFFVRTLAALGAVGVTAAFFTLDLVRSTGYEVSIWLTMMIAFAGLGPFYVWRNYPRSRVRTRVQFFAAFGTCFAFSMVRSYKFLLSAGFAGVVAESLLTALLALIASFAVILAIFAYSGPSDQRA